MRNVRLSGTFSLRTAAFCLLSVVFFSRGGHAVEKTLLSTSFEEGDVSPTGWSAEKGAQWASFARTGKRSLELRTWIPDSELSQLVAEKIKASKEENVERLKELNAKVKTDATRSWWIGPQMELSGQPVKVSFWGANNITYMNDESFRAEVALVRTGADGAVRKNEDGTLAGPFLSDPPLHFYRDQRENYQLYARAVPEGLRWEYRELVLKPGAGTYRALLHFMKDPDGQVWVDDLMVTESPDYLTRDEIVAAKTEARPKLPWRMEINFPVSYNLFKKRDPLEMDLALIADDGPPGIPAGMTLQYEIRDYNHRWIHEERVPVEPGDCITWSAPRKEDGYKGYLPPNMKAAMEAYEGHTVILPVALPQSLNSHDGQMLFVKAAVYQGSRMMAQDEVTFGIIVPGVPKKENLWRGGKVVGNWMEKRGELETDYMKEDGGPNNLLYKCGGQWNATGLSHNRWYSAWKKKEDPIDMGPEPKVHPEHGFMLEFYLLQSYRKYNVVPKWAQDRSEESIKKYGYWVFDKEAYAQYLEALVKRMHQQFPNGTAICPTAGEAAHDRWRFELQQFVYPRLKAASPTTQVGVWYWGGDVSQIEPYKDSYDFFDSEFYADPRMVGKEGPAAARKHSQRLGRPIWAGIMEGCALIGSEEQPESARGVFDTHLFQWQHGTKLVGQFEFGEAYTRDNGDPLLRAPLQALFGGTGHVGGARRLKLTRYDMAEGKNQRKFYQYGKYPTYWPSQFQPALPTMALCNLVRFLDSAVFERQIRMREAYVFQFERLGRTILFLEGRGMSDFSVEVRGATAKCETLDIYGYRHQLDPADGKLLLTLGHHPLILMFDQQLARGALGARALKDVKVTMSRPIVRSTAGEIAVNLGEGRGGELQVLVDEKLEVPASITASPGREARVTITPLEERPTGRYRTYIHVNRGAKSVGLLSIPLEFQGTGIAAQLVGIPMTKGTDPAMRAIVRNDTTEAAEVTVKFRDDYTASGPRAVEVEKDVSIPAGGKAHVDFPLDRSRLKPNHDYDLAATLVLPDGAERTVRGSVFFRGVPKRKAPITIDANLSDWPLTDLPPLEPDWTIMIGGRTGGVARNYSSTWEQQSSPTGKYRAWFLWDDEGLYFAAVSNNPNKSHKNKADVAWDNDCMYLTIYFDKWVEGGGSTMRPIKMHLATDEKGNLVLQDMHAKIMDPKELGVEYARKETDTGYVYEFFMGRTYIGDLKLEPGSGFSVSTVSYNQRRGTPMGIGVQSGRNTQMYAFFRHCFDFDGGIEDMARFVLTEE